MALTKVSQPMSSTPSIDDNGTATALTIDSSQSATFAGNISIYNDLNSAATNLATSVSEAALQINGATSAGSDSIWAGKIQSGGANYIQVSNSAGTTPYPLSLNPYGGKVGIGVTNPDDYYADKLVVQGAFDGDGITIVSSATTTDSYLAFADGTTGNERYRGAIGYYHGSDALVLYSAGSERMRLDASGNVLVGTTTNQNASGARFSVVNPNSTYGYGFGTISNYSPFYVIPGVTGGTGNGVYLTYNGGSWTSNSDETLKENIEDVGSVLSKISSIRTVKYNFIGDEDKKIGFIAQDWINDFPEVVSTDERTGKLGIQYTETIAVLMKAIQEQQAQIETLKAEVAALKGE